MWPLRSKYKVFDFLKKFCNVHNVEVLSQDPR
jgi:hypothetical protein